MRVTFIVEQYLDEGSRYYKKAFELLGASGYVPSVINLNRSEAFRADVGPLTARFDELGLPGGYHKGLARLGRLLREHAADVLHGMETIPTFFAGVAKMLGRLEAPLIYHRHHGPTPSGRVGLMDRFAFTRAARVIAVSRHQAELAATEHSRQADKVRVVYNGIGLGTKLDAGRDSGIARSIEELGPGPRLLLLGRLRPEKGHVIALDALRILLKEEPRTKMLFAGEGPHREAIETAIEERGLGGAVVLLGAVADVGEVLSFSDVLIVPSLAESFGLTAVEGFAAEVPVVAAAVGGLLETVVDGRSGLLVPPEDPGALAAAVERVLRDDGLRGELVSGAKRSYLENFTPEVMVAGFMSLYEELTDRS